MKKTLVLAALALTALAGTSHAFAASCDAQAAEKKLAGAAKNSFVKKCVADGRGDGADSACAMKASEKHLAGAAKNSFMKKCVADAAK